MTSQPSKDSSNRGRALPPALNVEMPALTQPFKDYVSRGLVEIHISFSAMGNTVRCRALGPIRKDGDAEFLPYGEIKRRVEESNLVKPKGNTKKNSNRQPAPLKSLCEDDFKGSDEFLVQRIRAVATALGHDVARARIMTHRLNEDGHGTFEEWWSSSGPEQRALLLMDKKHHDKVGTNITKLNELSYPCPFRGALLSSQTAAEAKTATTKGAANTAKPKVEAPNANQSRGKPAVTAGKSRA